MPSGTITADGTEQEAFTASTGPGEVFWYVSTRNLQAGDEVVIRQKVDVDNNSSFETHREQTLSGAQSSPVVSQNEQLLVDSEVPVKITVEQTSGTLRDLPFVYGVKF